MAGNLGCFTVGCNDAVVGQCSGYKGSCGQFYCHNHSARKLCSECGERKNRDEIAAEYLAAAEKIRALEPSAAKTSTSSLVLMSIIGGVILMGMNRFAYSLVWVIFWLVLAVPYILYIHVKNKRIKKAIADTNKIKTGFSKFYQMYKKAKDKAEDAESRARLSEAALGLLGAVVVGAAVGAGASAKAMVDSVMEPTPTGTTDDVVRAIRHLEKKL